METRKRNINVIIADNDPHYLKSTTAILNTNREMNVIGSVCNGKKVFDLLELKFADIIITDVHMPVMDGIELSKLVKQKYPWVKVLVLSMFTDRKSIFNLSQCTANGYLSKDANGIDELLFNAINTIMKGWFFSFKK